MTDSTDLVRTEDYTRELPIKLTEARIRELIQEAQEVRKKIVSEDAEFDTTKTEHAGTAKRLRQELAEIDRKVASGESSATLRVEKTYDYGRGTVYERRMDNFEVISNRHMTDGERQYPLQVDPLPKKTEETDGVTTTGPEPPGDASPTIPGDATATGDGATSHAGRPPAPSLSLEEEGPARPPDSPTDGGEVEGVVSVPPTDGRGQEPVHSDPSGGGDPSPEDRPPLPGEPGPDSGAPQAPRSGDDG